MNIQTSFFTSLEKLCTIKLLEGSAKVTGTEPGWPDDLEKIAEFLKSGQNSCQKNNAKLQNPF